MVVRSDGLILDRPTHRKAVVQKDGGKTELEWVTDSDFRFFPAIADPMLGYCLHPVDLVTNKVGAAVGRL